MNAQPAKWFATATAKIFGGPPVKRRTNVNTIAKKTSTRMTIGTIYYMAERKRDWMWRRLSEGATGEKPKRPTNYRRPDVMTNAQGQTVRTHVPHPTTLALDRFVALTERRVVGDDTCVIWKGGDTFRIDDDTITTPARFYWETLLGEKLGPNEVLYRGCKTPRCVKHKVKR
jgi:hypothetical protein